MTTEQAHKLIAERAEALSKNEQIITLCKGMTKEQAVDFVYKAAIATLYGRD